MVYRISKEIVVNFLSDSEVAIVQLQTKKIFTLNELGIFIWKLISDQLSEEEITEKIVQTFEVSKETAKRDLDQLLSQLKKEQILN